MIAGEAVFLGLIFVGIAGNSSRSALDAPAGALLILGIPGRLDMRDSRAVATARKGLPLPGVLSRRSWQSEVTVVAPSSPWLMAR